MVKLFLFDEPLQTFSFGLLIVLYRDDYLQIHELEDLLKPLIFETEIMEIYLLDDTFDFYIFNLDINFNLITNFNIFHLTTSNALLHQH